MEHIKDKVYIINSDLKESIKDVALSVAPAELEGGMNTMCVQCDLCLEAKGKNFQHWLNCGKVVNLKVKFFSYML